MNKNEIMLKANYYEMHWKLIKITWPFTKPQRFEFGFRWHWRHEWKRNNL